MSLFRKSKGPAAKAPATANESDLGLLVWGWLQLDACTEVYQRLLATRAAGASGEEVAPEAVAWARTAAKWQLELTNRMYMEPPPLMSLSADDRNGTIVNWAALRWVGCSLLLLAEDELASDALVPLDKIEELLTQVSEWREQQRGHLAEAQAEAVRIQAELERPLVKYKPQLLPVPPLLGGMHGVRWATREDRPAQMEAIEELGPAADGLLGNRKLKRMTQKMTRQDAGDFLFSLMRWLVVLASVLINRGELTLELDRRWRQDGPSEELDGLALRAAADIAVCLNWMTTNWVQKLLSEASDLDPAAAQEVLYDAWASLLMITTRDDPVADGLAPGSKWFLMQLEASPICELGKVIANDAEFIPTAIKQLQAARAEGADEDQLLALTARLLSVLTGPGPVDGMAG